MHKLSVALLFFVLAQVACSELFLEEGDVVIRAKRSETIEGSGEGSGEIQEQIEGSGQTVTEGSGEASGEPVPTEKASPAAEPTFLSETVTKEDKPADHIAV